MRLLLLVSKLIVVEASGKIAPSSRRLLAIGSAFCLLS